MPIQIIPKPEEKQPLLPSVLLYFSIFVLIFAGSSYFVLNNLLQKAEKDIASVAEEKARLDSSPESGLEREILSWQKKINDFSNLLNGYQYSSQVFPFIEKLAHPKVSFSNFGAGISDGSVSLSGMADSFQTVQQQFDIFRGEKLIKSVKLSGVSLGEKGKIPFIFNLVLDPAVFTQKDE